MGKIRVLFVCVHNSARSQMAEAFLAALGGDRFEARSAGLEPGVLLPEAVEVMKETGIDISKNQTKSAFDFLRRGEFFGFVITVCDAAAAERCPVFPGSAQRLHWSFPDPSTLPGTPEERLAGTRKIRDMIKVRVEDFIRTNRPAPVEPNARF
jgi:arsenate reductase